MSQHWASHTPEALVLMVGPSDLWWEPVHRLLWIKKCIACEESPGNNVSSLIGCSATPRHTCAWIGLLLFFLPVSHWLLAHRRFPTIICPCTFQWILYVLSGFFFFFFEGGWGADHLNPRVATSKAPWMSSSAPDDGISPSRDRGSCSSSPRTVSLRN